MSATLSPEHLAAIGSVAVEAARLESLIGHLLADAISADDEVSHLLVTPMRFEQRAQLLQRVLMTKLGGRPDLNETIKAIQSASTAMHARNRFLHALCEFSEEDQLQTGKRENKTGMLVMTDVSLSDVTSAAEEIAAIARRIEPAYFDLLIDLGVFAKLDEGIFVRVKAHRPYEILHRSTPTFDTGV